MIENYINRKFKTTQALELEEQSDDRIKKRTQKMVMSSQIIAPNL